MSLETKVKLKAIADIDVFDMFEKEHHFNKGETINGTVMNIKPELTLVRIQFNLGENSFYTIECVKENFKIID